MLGLATPSTVALERKCRRALEVVVSIGFEWIRLQLYRFQLPGDGILHSWSCSYARFVALETTFVYLEQWDMGISAWKFCLNRFESR